MNGLGGIWAFLGPREVVVVGLLVLALYGRSGLHKNPYLRLLKPWTTPPRPPTTRATATATVQPAPRPAKSTWETRTFWFLAILAATAVAAWIVTRTLILGAPTPSH